MSSDEGIEQQESDHAIKEAVPSGEEAEKLAQKVYDGYEPFRIFSVHDHDNPKVITDIAARPNAEANAELIVTAVNAYEPMLKTLMRVRTYASLYDCESALHKRIAKMCDGGHRARRRQGGVNGKMLLSRRQGRYPYRFHS